MPEILQLAHLVEQHGVSQVQVGRGGIEARLDAQRATQLELFDQFGFEQQLFAATFDLIKDFLLIHVERPLVIIQPNTQAGFEGIAAFC